MQRQNSHNHLRIVYGKKKGALSVSSGPVEYGCLAVELRGRASGLGGAVPQETQEDPHQGEGGIYALESSFLEQLWGPRLLQRRESDAGRSPVSVTRRTDTSW